MIKRRGIKGNGKTIEALMEQNKDDIRKKCGVIKRMSCICPNCNGIIWGC